MKNFLQYVGIIVLLLGVLCLVVYKYAVQDNALLISAMVLQVLGILSFIFINKRIG
jgi:uncharacterized membrane protein YwaF